MRGNNSTEYNTIVKLLDTMKVDKYDIDIITADNTDMKPCIGCCKCFETGHCSLDGIDQMRSAKDKMKNADIIIISSPVYLHHISGSTKTFLDRISYWAHTFHLIGKRAIICSSTATTGNEYVISYLKKAMSAFGCLIVGELAILQTKSDDEYKTDFNRIINSINESYRSPNDCKVTNFQHELYYSLKNTYSTTVGTYESNYWNENNLFNYYSFEELLHEKLSIITQ
jgi:multimeric flavodoxin WrbA